MLRPTLVDPHSWKVPGAAVFSYPGKRSRAEVLVPLKVEDHLGRGVLETFKESKP